MRRDHDVVSTFRVKLLEQRMNDAQARVHGLGTRNQCARPLQHREIASRRHQGLGDDPVAITHLEYLRSCRNLAQEPAVEVLLIDVLDMDVGNRVVGVVCAGSPLELFDTRLHDEDTHCWASFSPCTIWSLYDDEKKPLAGPDSSIPGAAASAQSVSAARWRRD